MAKRSLASLNAGDLSGKRVLVRVDFNVPLNDAGAITDDTRIRAALPTINDLVGKGAKVVLSAHFGRPKGQVNDAMRLTPVAARLSELLGKTVTKTDSCIGPDAEAKVGAMANGDVVLLENVRFFAEEEKNDAGFAEKLAASGRRLRERRLRRRPPCPCLHRGRHQIPEAKRGRLPNGEGASVPAGCRGRTQASPRRHRWWFEGELQNRVLEALIDKCDKVLIGGGMIFTFYKARGLAVGKSLVEETSWNWPRSWKPRQKPKVWNCCCPPTWCWLTTSPLTPTAKSPT
jgi:phosphoglycerate kinase